MSGRVRAVSGHVDAPIEEGWQLGGTSPGSIIDPEGLSRADLEWLSAVVPSTAAAALRAAGRWSLDSPARRFDADDWWWRVRFPGALAGEAGPNDEVVLCLDGIATLAEVWLNGVRVTQTDNMFTSYRVPVSLRDDNELVIACRSVDARLAMKKPRPRWRAPMVEHPHLRWIRTTLLGRVPGWSPPAAPVGPWRPVRLERRRGVAIEDLSLRACVDGTNGILEVRAVVRRVDGSTRAHSGTVELVVEANGTGIEHRVAVDLRDGVLTGRLVIPDVALWWPHTHGEPALYRARLVASPGASVPGVELGNVGFRTVTADTTDGGFALVVNGAAIFCRGACWTPIDPVTLDADLPSVEAAFKQVVGAGMNMLRASGTMVYESDAFFDTADKAGVLIWQDLMFANMDYPADDPAFASSVAKEVSQQLSRWQARPSLAVVCGNSEGEQQAAMWGATRDRWEPALFHETFAQLSREHLPDVPYWPSSAHGGAFPHTADRGTTSYYGVGAYQRPLEDARRADVRFATECLAFANVPAPRTVHAMPGGDALKVHHPGWKARTPRDLGAGWDFDDVRDHYVGRLFGVDPAAVRYADHERYVALGRVATGEVMAQVFGEWRRGRSSCGGGLVWFLRDLWAGAGWGVIGADGEPKAAYHYLRRALTPVAVHISDESVNGIVVHAINDTAAAVEGELEIKLFRGDTLVGTGRGAIAVGPRSAIEVHAISLFEGFLDLNHTYRFGPPSCDLVVARLHAGAIETEAFMFPLGLPSARSRDLGVVAELRLADGDDLDLRLTTRSFAQSVAIELEGYVPDDDFFHLAPGASRTVRLRHVPSRKRGQRGTVTPLNAESSVDMVTALSSPGAAPSVST